MVPKMAEKRAKELRWYEKFSYSIVTNTEIFYYNLGKKIASYPWTTIAICWIFVFLSALGFLRFYQEKNPLHLWVPQNSQFKKDSDLLMNTFETAYRMENMLVEADDVLTPEVLLEVFDLDALIRGSYTPNGVKWTDVCFRIPEVDQSLSELMSGTKSYRKRNKTNDEIDYDPSVHMNTDSYCALVESIDKECFENSILDLWSYNRRRISKLTKQDIINKINNNKQDPLLGNLKNYESLLGGITRNKTGHIVAATALMTQYMLNLNFTAVDMSKIGNYAGTTEWGSLEALEWEEEFIHIMEKAEKSTVLFKLYYSAARSFGDISGATMFQGMDILFGGSLIMILYVQFVISKFNLVEARIYLAGCGLLSVLMAFIVGCGLCSLFGVFYGPVHTSLPFLLMGLGVDDMFVIVSCWDHLSSEQKRLPRVEKIGLMMKHAGVSITVTTATDVLAFIVGSTTVLPCLQSYCLFAGMGVLMTFIFAVTFFVACFTIDQKRIDNNINGFFPWKKYENYKPNKFSQAETSSQVFKYVYSKVILTWPGKLFVILITLLCLGFSVQSMLKLEQRFDPKWFIPNHSYLGKFLNEKSIFFPTSGYEAFSYMGAVNYSYEVNNIEDMVLQLENSTDIISDISSWVEPFRNYVKTYFKQDIYNDVLSDDKFNEYLSKFLFSPKGARFQANFQFENELKCGHPAPKIIISSVEYKFNLFSGPDEYIPAMRRVMNMSKNVDFTTGNKFSTAWSKIFATWITDEIIEQEVIRNIELALVAVMICTSLLIANVQICFWVFICIVLSMINVCGFMQRWNLTIDIVSCIGLQLAIGLCVDYATHIGHTFLTIGEGSLNERVVKTVASIGTAVLYGGLSTLIGVSFLGFSDAYNFQTFFKIFTLVIIFGLFHGIVLLPVILSWIGPKPYYSHKLVAQSDIES